MRSGKDAEFKDAVRAALLMHTCPISFWQIVERRDGEDMIPTVAVPLAKKALALVLGPAGRWLALAALVLAVWGHGWVRGVAHEERKQAAARALEVTALGLEVQRLARAASEIEIVWVNTTTRVRERARVVTKEVPVYVSSVADSRCVVPRGFVGLWNLDLQAELYDPATAAGGNDEAAGLALSDVARDGVIPAKERFEGNRAALTACQSYVRELRRNADGAP